MSEEIIENNEELEQERSIVFEEALEAILFAAGHPVTYATLARVTNLTPAKVKDKVFEYAIKYNNPQIPRGVTLLTFADSCQLCTNQYYLPEIRDALGIKKSGTLSTSSIEVLAIIAYNQPVTRAFVDTLRRVDSSYAMNNLLDRGLIHSTGRLDVPGRPMLYGTTSDFLRCFGLNNLDSLPKTSEEMLEVFSTARTNESESIEQKQAESSDVLPDQIEVDFEGLMPENNNEEADKSAEEEYFEDELSAEDEIEVE